MKPEAQWYLVEALATARGQIEMSESYESKQGQLSHFAGILAGFRYLEVLTQEEEEDWYHRMLVACGYELPDPSPPGVSRSIYVGDPAKRAPPPLPRTTPVFVRSQPGPEEEFHVYGCGLRVIAVEFYDSAVVVRWHVSPQPDIASVFPGETAALERDVTGLEEWAAEELRQKGYAKLAMMRLYRFGLRDDLGTSYVQLGLRHGSGPNGMTGEAEFPAPPPDASVLLFSWLGLEVPIPIG